MDETTIADLLDEIDRKPKDYKNSKKKKKIYLFCARCGKLLQSAESSCECHGRIVVEIEIKNVIIKKMKKSRKIRGE